MENDDKSNQNDPEYSIYLAEEIHSALSKRVPKLETMKQNRVTEGVISAVCEAYKKVNLGSNGLGASADKQTNHLREQHKEYCVIPFSEPRLDLHLTGGKRELNMESELGSRREVKKDFEKLKDERVEGDKIMVTLTESEGARDRDVDMVIEASQNDGGTYTHVELHKKHKEIFSKSEVRTRTYVKGDKVYDSEDIGRGG